MSRFQRPLPLPHLLDEGKVNELFNYARNFDLDEIKLFSLQNHLPLSVINNKNENLIHITTYVDDTTVSEEKRLKIIKYLVNNGVHPDLPNNQGITPLHYACQKQYSKVISYLLELEVNPNAPDYLGKTPLHYLLSGIIKNWVNKKPRPLVTGNRETDEEENRLKKELKLEIYSLIKESKLKDLENFTNVIMEDLEEEEILSDLSKKLSEQKSLRLDISNIGKIIGSVIEELKNDYGNRFNNSLFLEVDDFSGNVTDLIKKRVSDNNKSLEENIKNDLIKLNKVTKFCNDEITDDNLRDKINNNRKLTDLEKGRQLITKVYNNKLIDPTRDYLDFINNIFVLNKDSVNRIQIIDKDFRKHIETEVEKADSALKVLYYLFHQGYDLRNRSNYDTLDLKRLDDLESNPSNEEVIIIITEVASKNNTKDNYVNIAVRLFQCIFNYHQFKNDNYPNLELLDSLNQIYFLGYQLHDGLNEVYLQIIRILMNKPPQFYDSDTDKDDTWIEIGNKQLERIEGSLKSINFYRFLFNKKEITNSDSTNERIKRISSLLDLNFIGTIDGDSTKSNILKLYQKIFCKCVNETEKLLYSGKYPILKVLKIEDLNNLDKYWAKVMKYHMRLLIYLFSHMQVIFNGGLGEYLLKNKINFDYDISDINELIDNVNKNNIYIFLYHRFSNKGRFTISDYYETEIPDLRRDLILPEKILSYSYSDFQRTNPLKLRKQELVGGAISNNSLFPYHLNKTDDVKKTEPIVEERMIGLNQSDFPESLKTSQGLNIFYNIFVFNIVKKLLVNDRINKLVEDLVKTTGFNLKDFSNLKNQVILNIVKELLDQYLDSFKDKLAREKLSNIIDVPKVKEQLINQITNFDESIALQVINYDLEDADLETIIQKIYFPIMESKLTNPDDFYFSNDYSKSDYELQIREIKFNKEALMKLLENGANPFIEDKLNESSLYLLSKNYCVSPLEILGQIGIDLRVKNNNNISSVDILKKEKERHLIYLNPNSNNLNEYLGGFTDKYHEEIIGMIESKESSGFNYPRYSKLGLNLMLYFIINQLSDNPIDILRRKLRDIDSYENDYTLGQKIMMDKGESTKGLTRKLNFNGSSVEGKTILDKWTNFTDNTFTDSPALFLDSINKLLKEITRIPRIENNDKKVLSYFINHPYYRENDLFEKTSKWVHLISKMVLATQVQLIIGNLIFAHYQLKNPDLDLGTIRTEYETDIKQVILNDKYKQTLPDLIREVFIPKLVKSIALTFTDEVDKESHDEYTISDMMQEIVDCLSILGIVTPEDRVIKVLQNEVNEYLDVYLPRYIQSLRCIAENYYRWVINYNKIEKLISLRAS